MRNKRFKVAVKNKEDVFAFTEFNSAKKIDEWFAAYEANPVFEEIQVYILNNDKTTYTLIHSENRRRIGF